MRRRRDRQRHSGNRVAILALLVAAASLALAAVTGSIWGAFTNQSQSAGNEIKGAADWVAPTASASVIQKTQGGITGYIHQGGSYKVYANVADAGQPASGTSSVTANLSTFDTGVTSSPLTSGAFSIGGSSYNYGGTTLTANSTLAASTYSYTLTSADAAANSRAQSGYSVIVENTSPTASAISSANKTGGINGLAEIGDSIVFTFSEQIDPNSIIAGWSGASTNVVVHLNEKGGVSNNDSATIFNAANTTQLPLGLVDLGRPDYTNSNLTFGASGTPSTMTQSGSTITVVLGTIAGTPTTALGTGTMVWTPSSSAYDRAANAETTTARSETGTADKEF